MCNDNHIVYNPSNKRKNFQIYIETINITHPEVANEWHPILNENWKPTDFTQGSQAKVWWLCSRCKSSWDAIIKSRTSGRGCPFCAGKKVNETNCLATINPDLAKQWHPTENKEKTPYNVSIYSHFKARWKCDQCPSVYTASIANRSNGEGCPFCAGKKVNETNSLASLFPNLSLEWHPTLNGDLQANSCTANNGRIVWWLCPKNKEHIYPMAISARTRVIASGCPFCSGRRADSATCLAAVYPEIAAEWHPTLNGNKIPQDVRPNYGKKIWWQCPNNKNHRYEATPNSRVSARSGCPDCSRTKNAKFTGEYLHELLPNVEIKSEYPVYFPNEPRPKRIDYCFTIKNQIYFIEYNGDQHYKPIRWSSSMSIEEANVLFAKQKKRDKKIKSYCKSNDIILIIIDGRKFKYEAIKVFLKQTLDHIIKDLNNGKF
jgi:hypothetical protein